MALQKDKHGITVLPDVARIDQYGEVAVKRFNPRVGWNQTEHFIVRAHYVIQGKEILAAALRHIKLKDTPIDTLLLSKLCHKAANAFLESDKACSSYKKKYGAYGLGETGK